LDVASREWFGKRTTARTPTGSTTGIN
jgi:hypothetical protein